MKYISLILSVFTLSLLLQVYGVHAEDVCGSQKGYNLYTCRSENICSNYESEKPVYASKDFERAEDTSPEFQNEQTNAPALDSAKKIYRENMGNIYKCGMIQSQRNSLNKLAKFIKQESSGQLSDALGGQIKQRINRLELSSNSIGCALTDTTTEQNKLNILRETTHQLCKYTSYLEYIKSFYEDTGNSYSRSNPGDSQLTDGTYDAQTIARLTKTTPRALSNEINTTKNAIANEISRTYKIYPVAFHAYSEYENNFPIHFLLEVIKGDFLILRQLMYQNLMPIAQLGLKVINAMSF